ncbi:hypothetical protein JCM8202_005287 [Rhodotorula sphaerocarpa]
MWPLGLLKANWEKAVLQSLENQLEATIKGEKGKAERLKKFFGLPENTATIKNYLDRVEGSKVDLVAVAEFLLGVSDQLGTPSNMARNISSELVLIASHPSFLSRLRPSLAALLGSLADPDGLATVIALLVDPRSFDVVDAARAGNASDLCTALARLDLITPAAQSAGVYAYTSRSTAIDGPLPAEVQEGQLNAYVGQGRKKHGDSGNYSMLPTAAGFSPADFGHLLPDHAEGSSDSGMGARFWRSDGAHLLQSERLKIRSSADKPFLKTSPIWRASFGKPQATSADLAQLRAKGLSQHPALLDQEEADPAVLPAPHALTWLDNVPPTLVDLLEFFFIVGGRFAVPRNQALVSALRDHNLPLPPSPSDLFTQNVDTGLEAKEVGWGGDPELHLQRSRAGGTKAGAIRAFQWVTGAVPKGAVEGLAKGRAIINAPGFDRTSKAKRTYEKLVSAEGHEVRLATKKAGKYITPGISCPKPLKTRCDLLEFSDAGVRTLGTPLGTALTKNALVAGQEDRIQHSTGSLKIRLSPPASPGVAPTYSIEVEITYHQETWRFFLDQGDLWASIKGQVPFTEKAIAHLHRLGKDAGEYAVERGLTSWWGEGGSGQ